MSDDTKLAVGSITQLTTEPALPIGGEGALWAAGAQSRRITELEAALAAKDQEIERLRDELEDRKEAVEDWKDRWRYERSHGCPHWGNHTSDGRDRVCWYGGPARFDADAKCYAEQKARLQRAEELLRELVECHDEARRPSSGLIERTGNPDTQARYRRSIAAWERARAYFQSKEGA